MHSKYATSTTITSTSTLTQPMQLPTNPSLTAHLHDPYGQLNNSKTSSPSTQTSSTTIPNTDLASTPRTNPQPNTMVLSTSKMLDFNQHQNNPHITQPCLPVQCPTNLPGTKCCPTNSHTPQPPPTSQCYIILPLLQYPRQKFPAPLPQNHTELPLQLPLATLPHFHPQPNPIPNCACTQTTT